MSGDPLLIMTDSFRDRLFAHLFPGDGDEHGAVIAAGVARTPRGLRLLARDLFLARDGVDYVPGKRGYRMLTGAFVTQKIVYCRDQGLCYLAVHNHGGSDRVGFSRDDIISHERGYPALLTIARGLPVGGIVFARNAVAGDIWLSKTVRVSLTEARITGRTFHRLWSEPPPRAPGADARYDRQSRLFGDAGQDLLAGLSVGVIGAGGAGSLIIQHLARLGVGHVLVVDPERLDLSNLPRVVGATAWDARAWITRTGRPGWLQRLGRLSAAKKVRVMKRLARRADRRVELVPVFGDVTKDEVAHRLTGCDYLFLAADSFQVRLVFNALVHQYLVPGVQVGAKVPVDSSTGKVGDVYSVCRPVTPTRGCLWCNGLIPPARLQEEAATPTERRAQRYVDDQEVEVPSVITLNATVASQATNDFLFTVTGLREVDTHTDYLRMSPRARALSFERPRRDSSCSECGDGPASRRAMGDGVELPTR